MNVPPAIDLFEWVGPVRCCGNPKFASIHELKCWSKISTYFLLREFNANDIELIFVNQIRGIPIGNSPISPSTRNKSNGGIQCSSSGPDIFSLQISSPFQNLARVCFKFDKLKLKETLFQQSKIYVRSKQQNKRMRSEQLCKGNSAHDRLIDCWKSSCKFSTKRGIVGSYLVVEKKDWSRLSKFETSMAPIGLKDMTIVPDLASLEDDSSPYQFFCLFLFKIELNLKRKAKEV